MNPIGRPATINEAAWIVSSMLLALISGPLFSMVALKFITKKSILLASMAPLAASHLICCFAHDVTSFLLARIFMGVGTGAIWAILGTYIGEIAEPSNRGFLGSITGISSSLGSLMVYVAGPYLSTRNFGILNLVPIALFYVTFSFVPDSPYDLVLKEKFDHAEISLMRLRQSSHIKKELEFIKDTVTMGSDNKVHFRDFIKDRTLCRGLLICVGLMGCQTLSGIHAVVSYAETIFSVAGNFIPAAYAPMIFGVFAVVAISVSSGLVDKMGRKSLLAGSCVVESISLFGLGLYFVCLNAGYDVTVINWLPVVSVIVFQVAFNFALGCIPWIVTGEVFHSNVKGAASTLVSISNFILAFLVTICFPYLVECIGMGLTFWGFAIIMLLGAAFCLFILPETKGKNFQEIQELLKR